jgi:putative phosphoribosyl transferase
VVAAEQAVSIAVGGAALDADLSLPDSPVGMVAFAHGSGSGRHSPRNRMVAGQLQDVGLATLLADLLTADEEHIDLSTRRLRFDMDLLADRVVGVVDWLVAEESTAHLALGLFGASTGAGAALIAAARRPERVACVVSRGGRPDLARHHLSDVAAPTLLIVGERDTQVIELNRAAMTQLPGDKELTVVPGASHLFEEPGALEEVARLASRWFLVHLAGKD